MGMIKHAACSSVGQGIASLSGTSPRCIRFVYLDTISAFYAKYAGSVTIVEALTKGLPVILNDYIFREGEKGNI
ncbi:hypothetical protein Tco_0465611 [Tanacetum coccineum]